MTIEAIWVSGSIATNPLVHHERNRAIPNELRLAIDFAADVVRSHLIQRNAPRAWPGRPLTSQPTNVGVTDGPRSSNTRFSLPNAMVFRGVNKATNLCAVDGKQAIVGLRINARCFEDRQGLLGKTNDLQVGKGHTKPLDCRGHFQQLSSAIDASENHSASCARIGSERKEAGDDDHPVREKVRSSLHDEFDRAAPCFRQAMCAAVPRVWR